MTTVIEKSQSMSAYSPVSDHCLMIVLIYFLDNTFFFSFLHRLLDLDAKGIKG